MAQSCDVLYLCCVSEPQHRILILGIVACEAFTIYYVLFANQLKYLHRCCYGYQTTIPRPSNFPIFSYCSLDLYSPTIRHLATPSWQNLYCQQAIIRTTWLNLNRQWQIQVLMWQFLKIDRNTRDRLVSRFSQSSSILTSMMDYLFQLLVQLLLYCNVHKLIFCLITLISLSNLKKKMQKENCKPFYCWQLLICLSQYTA